MTAITLLSPARDKHIAHEAILHGADAVYIGAERFGARQGAGNSVEDIKEVCQEAHTYGVKVYVTVNTILYDDELDEAQQLAWDLYHAGADALIIQDMAFMKMSLPPIALHASTQMDNETREKVAWLRDLGFEQVVLARELTLAETRAIHEAVPDVRLEAFIHGSTCVCYNGRCYASQYCFHRSANRGECAQFCRLPFDLLDSEGHVIREQQHLLSLHDMRRDDDLEALLDAGITCLKIEGRLKDAAYVKNVTAYYSQRLDHIIRLRPSDYQRASRGRVSLTFTPDPARTFNRGYTPYFLHGRTPHLIEPRTPKSTGERVGTVKDVRQGYIVVASLAAFASGDGLCFFTPEGRLKGFRVNRAEGNRLYTREPVEGLRKGMTLYRNLDQAFTQLLARPTAERRIPVRWTLSTTTDGFTLALDGHSATFIYPHTPARTPQREAITRQLARLGDTPYTCEGVDIRYDEEWFIPASTLAEWRRALTAGAGLQACAPRHGAQAFQPAMTGGAGFQPAEPGGACAPSHSQAKSLPPQSNRLARAFYEEQGLPTTPAFELQQPPHPTLMTTRYCLRYELGMCTQSKNSTLHTPKSLALRLADGRTFPLRFDCRRCLMHVLGCLLLLLTLTSCYHKAYNDPAALNDSIDFAGAHHYGTGYNFTLWADSLTLEREVPSLAQALVDSPDVATVYTGAPIVVADVYIDSTDLSDSVWIKIADTQGTQGWVHESDLLPAVVPDDPISESIMLFSNGHIKATLCILVAAAFVFLMRRLKGQRHTALYSPYPTLLQLTLSGAAVLYASLQMFAPDAWADYYFHPTLNPFALTPVLGAFVGSVWLLFIFMIAVVDDTLRQFSPSAAALYLLTLFARLGLEYLIFSLSTLAYIGYPLYIIYIVWAVRHYCAHLSPRYRCGQCGQPMHSLGRCPRCKHLNE